MPILIKALFGGENLVNKALIAIVAILADKIDDFIIQNANILRQTYAKKYSKY